MKKGLAWMLCAAWMVLIFTMSAMTGEESGAQSGRMTAFLLNMISQIAGERAAENIEASMLELIVRKGAHMAEYAVLFCLMHHALFLSGAKHSGIMALVLCALYAASDEWHQRFVGGRGPSFADVMIDSAGAGVACICAKGVECIRHIIKKQEQEKGGCFHE